MDRHTLVECVLNVGQRYSIDTKDFGALTLKLIILSVKYVSKTELWNQRFPEEYVDWELVNKVVGRNILGGCAEWLALLSFCKWPDIGNHEASMQLEYPPLHVIRSHLKSCNLDSGGSDAWEVACKVFLVMLLQSIPSQNALELMTCELYKRNTRDGVVQLLAKQAEHLFTPAQYQTTLQFILDKCSVDAKSLQQTLALCEAAREDKKLCLKMSRMAVIQGRPRLRDRVSSVLGTQERKTQVDTMLDTWESYTGFCYLHQFPPTLSEKIKTRLYFLASQTRWNWTRYLDKVLPSAGPLLERVAKHPVTQPDLAVILQVLESLTMDGSPPFPHMTEFRTSCFKSYPVTHVQRMTLSQILQLYVAAYQPASIWKEAWKHLSGVISVQIIRDVEAFVSVHAFAEIDAFRFISA